MPRSSVAGLSESIPFLLVTPKQKSLISIYDNPLEIPSVVASLPSVAILGGNKRAQAFEKRLLFAGFAKPLLCDVNSKERLDSISLEAVQQSWPTIVLITEDVPSEVRGFLDQNRQALVIDAREVTTKSSPIILGSHRAFGNFSDREISQGSDRVGVAIEHASPVDLIQFLDQFNCSSRGIVRLDPYSYTSLHRRSFPDCLFPFLFAALTFSFYVILSMLEHKDQTMDNTQLISRQASSMTASTSLTLLAVAFLPRPISELSELLHAIAPTPGKIEEISFNESSLDFSGLLHRSTALERWLQARAYLAWYSFSFACLHLLFLSFSHLHSTSTLFIVAFFFGLSSWISLTIFAAVQLPWISERLLWKEYYLFTSSLGPLCLLLSFAHVLLHWSLNSDVFTLKFFSLLLPLVVLILRLMISGIVRPGVKLIHWRRRRSAKREATVSVAC